MKGCLVTILVIVGLILLLFVGSLGFVGYQGSKVVKEIEAGMAEIHATDTVYPFSMPTDGKLDEARFDQFLTARRGAVASLDATLEHLRDGQSEPSGVIDAIQMALGAARAVIGAFQAVPRALAAELHQQKMSMAEYLWMAETIHGTLAAADRKGDPRATEVIDSFEAFFAEQAGPQGQQGIQIHGREVNYGALRHSLERRYRDFDPATLEQILGQIERIREPRSQVMLDVFLIGSGPQNAAEPAPTATPPDEH